MMTPKLRGFMASMTVLAVLAAPSAVHAQKAGGVLRMYSPDSPASMSILEEATVFAEGPMMGVFNNLVIYDQHVPQNSLQSIVPDLALGWSWNEDGTELEHFHNGSAYPAARK
jgi:peptide/nickel transport system substrate-binding protein